MLRQAPATHLQSPIKSHLYQYPGKSAPSQFSDDRSQCSGGALQRSLPQGFFAVRQLTSLHAQRPLLGGGALRTLGLRGLRSVRRAAPRQRLSASVAHCSAAAFSHVLFLKASLCGGGQRLPHLLAVTALRRRSSSSGPTRLLRASAEALALRLQPTRRISSWLSRGGSSPPQGPSSPEIGPLSSRALLNALPNELSNELLPCSWTTSRRALDRTLERALARALHEFLGEFPSGLLKELLDKPLGELLGKLGNILYTSS